MLSRLRNIDNTTLAAVILVLFSLVSSVGGYLTVHSTVDIPTILSDFYANISAEAASIAVTVLIIDQLNRQRNLDERKQELFDQVKSRSTDMAVNALEKIQRLGWWKELLEYYTDHGGLNISSVQWAGGVNLMSVKLQGADLRKANLQGVKLTFAKLQGAQLYQANLRGGDLHEADLEGADLMDTNLQEVQLHRANLQKAELWKANLQKADLHSANLENADLTFTNLREADLRYTNLREANLKWADLKDTRLAEANLERASLQSANLQSAELWKANLEGASLYSANLQGTSLLDVNLKTTYLGDVTFDTKTLLPDAINTSGPYAAPIFDKYWTPDTDMTRYTDPDHPDFWQPGWVKEQEDNSAD